MGIVYLARDTRLQRRVALKFLPRSISRDSGERARFQREARAAARLNHPNIAQVYAIEEDGAEMCIVMEYVEGRELRELIEDQALSYGEKLKVAEQVARGIKAAHDHDIIHRDIKSRNIIVSDDNQAKIMDFGLARLRNAEHLTETGATLGTTVYMSPEQLSGAEPDERTDIWSYGVVLYELFTGRLPFRGKYEKAVMYSITNEEPEPVSQLMSGAPPWLERMVDRCLAKEAGERYPDMKMLLEDMKLKSAGDNVSRESGLLSVSGLTPASSIVYFGVPALLILLFLLFVLPGRFSWLEGTVPEQKYIAVLPIENLDDNSEMESISEGLAETFSYRLSELERFEDSYWVAPASEMRKEQINSATQARQKFGVTLTVTSSMQTVADSTRLTLELVDTGDMRSLGAERVTVPSNNLAALEQEGVRAMLEMLQIEIGPNIAESLNEGQPSDPQAYEFYLKGRASLHSYITRDSLDRAVRMFDRAIEMDPDFALGYAGLGEAYWIQYETTQNRELLERADSVLHRALEINEDLAPLQELLGKLSREKGDYEQALHHFNRALEINPNYSTAYRGLASVYDRQGKTDMAVETYRKTIAEKPDSWEGYRDLGKYYHDSGQYEAAIEQFKKVLDLTPNSSIAYSNLGGSYYYNGQIEEARRMFVESLALENNAFAANNLAGIYYLEREYEEAIKMYKIAVNASPDRYDLWGNLAGTYEISGQSAQAREAYLTAIEKAHQQLEINSEDVQTLAFMGSYYSDINDTTNALKYIRRAAELNPSNIYVRRRALTTYEKLGMREEALEWVDSSLTSWIEAQPDFRELTEDSRYRELKDKWSDD